MDTVSFTSSAQIGAAASSIIVFVLGGLLPGVMLTLSVTLLLWHRQRARIAKEVVHTEARLAPGYAQIKGSVELEPGSPFGVRVRIWQRGNEWTTKQGLRHSWTEVSRQVETQVFFLVQRSGQRVRVAPDQNVFLVDALDRAERLGDSRRVVTAELSRGEVVVANGILARESDPHAAPTSYRTATGTGWVLRPPARERMLLSAEPLEQRYVRRASVHRIWAWVAAALLLLLNTLVFGNYHLLAVFGDVVQARVERTRTWKTTNKGRVTVHYGLDATVARADSAGLLVSDEINARAYVQLSASKSADAPRTVPFRVVSFWPSRHQVGDRPTLPLFIAMLALLVSVGCSIGYLVHARKSLPWYDKRRVIHRGSGPLIATELDS